MAATFRVEAFESLHSGAVAQLTAGAGGGTELEAEAFSQLRKWKDHLSKPLAFRQREDAVDLQALARHIQAEHPRLATEKLVLAVDGVSRSLRLHQIDCCGLVERGLDLTHDLTELPGKCAAMYYRECHFMALCLHDVAQSLVQSPPSRCGVAFFAMLGGPSFVKAVCEALAWLLRELAGERTGDQLFITHAGHPGGMIQLLVDTLFVYFYTFVATAEEVEQLISLLPHIVQAHQVQGHGQTVTLSDLDLILRDDHVDISTKLCFTLICMCYPHTGDGKLEIGRVPQDADPASLRLQDYAAGRDSASLLHTSSIGTKMQAGDYWNEESQLGQFLCFALNGVLLESEQALRNGYVHWNVFHFLLHEVLLSGTVFGQSCTSYVVLRCIHELLAHALLPVGRRWIAIRKLEAQAVKYRLLAQDGLQIAVLQTLNRLCRLHPPACETFRDIALYCSDTFHLASSAPLALPQLLPETGAVNSRAGLFSGSSMDATLGARWGPQFAAADQGGLPSSSVDRFGIPVPAAAGDIHMATAPELLFLGGACGEYGNSVWIGAPPRSAGASSPAVPATSHRDSHTLYAEILDLLASICARGSLHCARLVCQKLMSHSNQWFNWGSLLDSLQRQALAAAPRFAQAPEPLGGAAGTRASAAAPVAVALCHLVSAACGSRLWITQPPPQPSVQALQTAFYANAPSADAVANLLVELLSQHPEIAVKTACLGALAHLDLSVQAAKVIFTTLVTLLPTLLAGLGDLRAGSSDGALAIELLTCALRLVQSVAVSSGRYDLDLQPVTHIVVHHILMKLLANSRQFTSSVRYWRLAGLALRWLRMVLRGPLLPQPAAAAMPAVGNSGYWGDMGREPGGVRDPAAAARRARGNATAYVLQHLLSLNSPVFVRLMYLTLLHGRGVDGLAECRKGDASRPYVEQVAHVGLDTLRLLLQRDVLFCRLCRQQTAERVAAGLSPEMDPGSLLPAHRLLLSECSFPYPPTESEQRAATALNPFANRRLWQGSGPIGSHMLHAGSRANPSYFALVLEFAGGRSPPEVCKLAIFALLQCSLRDPATVYRTLQLEPWRLQCACADLYSRLLQPEETHEMACSSSSTRPRSAWNAQAESQFMFEAAEVDVPSPATAAAAAHLDVISFQTGLPVCLATDAEQQSSDDALVQSSDLLACVSPELGGADQQRGKSSAASRLLRASYLQGFEIPMDWLGGRATARAGRPAAGAAESSPPMLSLVPCRLLSLRMLILLLNGDVLEDADAAAPKLAQSLLGLDSDTATAEEAVDVDARRAGQPCLLDAVIQLLESPPALPAHLEGGSGSSQGLVPHGRSLRHVQQDPGIVQTLEQHATYEAALGVIACLLTRPALYDVTLRFVCHAWPSRYQVLRKLLDLPWPSLEPCLRRVLLSEVTLMLQILSAEFCVIRPAFAAQPLSSATDVVGVAEQQRIEMKRVVAEQLQEVVRSFFLSPAEETSSSMASSSLMSTPFLVSAALRLADATTTTPSAALPQALQQLPSATGHHGTARLFNDREEAALQEAACLCMAPSPKGGLSMCLRLYDPDAFRHRLVAGGLGAMGVPPLAHGGADGRATSATDLFLNGGEGADPALGSTVPVGALNEAACLELFGTAAFRALSLFMSGALYHLVCGIRPGAAARDPRRQAVRAHLDSLSGALAPSIGSSTRPRRLQLLTMLTTPLVATMHHTDKPLPLSFVDDLFCMFRGLATSAAATASEATAHELEQATLILLQRMQPDPHTYSGGGLKDRASANLSELRDLIWSLVLHSPTRSPSASSEGQAPTASAAMPLLTALLIRVPPEQLPNVFPGSDFWPKLMDLAIGGHSSMDTAAQLSLRLQVLHVAALFCRAPALASSLFETGTMAAMLKPDFLQGAVAVRFMPQGLPALETTHPAVLMGVLQLLVNMLSMLPKHRLLLYSILAWVEQQQKPLLELLQWVTRLPLQSSAEPMGPLGPNLSGVAGDDPGEMLQALRAASPSAGQGASPAPGRGLRVLCMARGAGSASSGSPSPSGHTLAVAACTLGGARRVIATGSAASSMSAETLAALCHRCTALFAELWALLWAAVPETRPRRELDWGQRGPFPPEAQRGEPLEVVMRRLEQPFADVMVSLLAQMSSLNTAPRPSREDVLMADTSREAGPMQVGGGAGAGLPRAGAIATGGGAEGQLDPADLLAQAQELLYPDEEVRLATCMHILVAWRHDTVSQLLPVLVAWQSSGRANLQPLLSAYRPHSTLWGTPPPATAPAVMGGMFPGVVGGAGIDTAQLLTQLRTRIHVLCVTAVHMCKLLLSLRVANAADGGRSGGGAATPWRGGGAGEGELVFLGSEARFRLVYLLVEIAIHLLHTHLEALAAATAALGGGAAAVLAASAAAAAAAAATASPSPAATMPRVGLLVRCLLGLRDLAARAAWGGLLPVEVSPTGPGGGAAAAGPHGRKEEAEAPSGRVLDLGLLSLRAKQVEELLMELQSL